MILERDLCIFLQTHLPQSHNTFLFGYSKQSVENVFVASLLGKWQFSIRCHSANVKKKIEYQFGALGSKRKRRIPTVLKRPRLEFLYKLRCLPIKRRLLPLKRSRFVLYCFHLNIKHYLISQIMFSRCRKSITWHCRINFDRFPFLLWCKWLDEKGRRKDFCFNCS